MFDEPTVFVAHAGCCEGSRCRLLGRDCAGQGRVEALYPLSRQILSRQSAGPGPPLLALA